MGHKTEHPPQDPLISSKLADGRCISGLSPIRFPPRRDRALRFFAHLPCLIAQQTTYHKRKGRGAMALSVDTRYGLLGHEHRR